MRVSGIVKTVDPLDVFLWTFRRSERDVIKLYDSLSDVMALATGGDMINFGLWDEGTPDPISAQRRLCLAFAEMAGLRDGERVLDVGCGYAAPAAQWHDTCKSEFFCVNINLGQLRDSQRNPDVASKSRMRKDGGIRLVNATATRMPFADCWADRVLAFESPQHFRPLRSFIAESRRILKPGGLLVLALPVVSAGTSAPVIRLGLLAMTWSSEHYTADFVLSLLAEEGFDILERQEIGPHVYGPLADYYSQNRDAIRQKLLLRYPGYVEAILNKSMQKMKQVSRDGIIGYLMVSCQKPDTP